MSQSINKPRAINGPLMFFAAVTTAAAVALGTAWALDTPAAQMRASGQPVANEDRSCAAELHGAVFSRTELLFGLDRPSGPNVTEAEFQRFVDREVTPRFPQGLTVLSALGQYQHATGAHIQEGSKLLILLHPMNETSSRAIESIRERYKADFGQESVLRIDEQSCVSF
jgi:hypothetical protein